MAEPLFPRKDFAFGKLKGKKPPIASPRCHSPIRNALSIDVEHASASIPSIILIALNIDMNQKISTIFPKTAFSGIERKYSPFGALIVPKRAIIS